MFRSSVKWLAVSLNGFSPLAKRPHSLYRNSSPQYAHPRYRLGSYRKLEPDDPTTVTTMRNLILMQCVYCQRVQILHSKDRGMFLTCCEGHKMRPKTDAFKMHRQHQRLVRGARLWDFANERPIGGMNKKRDARTSRQGR